MRESEFALMSEIAEAAVMERDEARAQCERLAVQNAALRSELKAFVDKVDSGMARSTESYGRMKAAIAAPIEPLVARYRAADALAQAYVGWLHRTSGEDPVEFGRLERIFDEADEAYRAAMEATK